MPDAIQEFVDSRGQQLRLDKATSVLQGVKLLGLASRNKRVYPETALREAIRLYEGARVNVNHPQGDPLGPRDYRDRLGVVRNVELRAGEGLFAALHFNPRHALAEQLVWDAQHAPENVGLSHNVVANTRRQGEQTIVESILHVQSVDLVADPATTSGLFEHEEPAPQEAAPGDRVAPLCEQDQLRQRVELAERKADLFAALAEHGLCVSHSPTDSAGVVIGEPLVRALLTCEETVDVHAAAADLSRLLRESAIPHRAVSAEQTPIGEATASRSVTTAQFVAEIGG